MPPARIELEPESRNTAMEKDAWILAACHSAPAHATSNRTFKILGEGYAQAPTISLDPVMPRRPPT